MLERSPTALDLKGVLLCGELGAKLFVHRLFERPCAVRGESRKQERVEKEDEKHGARAHHPGEHALDEAREVVRVAVGDLQNAKDLIEAPVVVRDGPLRAVVRGRNGKERGGERLCGTGGNRGLDREEPVRIELGRMAAGDDPVRVLADHAKGAGIDFAASRHALEKARGDEANVDVTVLHFLHDARHRKFRDSDFGKEALGINPLSNEFGGWNLPARKGRAAHDGEAFALKVFERAQIAPVGAHDDRGAVGVVGVGRLVRDDGRKRQAARALDHEAREAARGDRHVEGPVFGRLEKAVRAVDLDVDFDGGELFLHRQNRAAVVVVHDRAAVGVDDRKPQAFGPGRARRGRCVGGFFKRCAGPG